MREIILKRIDKLRDKITQEDIDKAMKDKSMGLAKEIAEKILHNSIITQVEMEVIFAFNQEVSK